MKKNTALLHAHLEAFMAVAEHKTVHAGAKAVHLSQTAMTQRIHNLEENLKTTLFIRTRQGMQLTSEGEKLLRYCRVVTDLTDETLATMMNTGIETIQRVKISGPSSIMASRIVPNCMKLMKKFPHLYMTFDIDDTENTISSLRSGSSQFAILRPEQITADLETKKLSPEKYLLVCTSKWKSRKLNDILTSERIIDFDAADQTSLNYLKQYNLINFAQSERLFVNRNESLFNMLIEGYGYGVLTKEHSKSLIESGDLIVLNAGKTFDNTLALAWYKRPEPPKYFVSILEIIV